MEKVSEHYQALHKSAVAQLKSMIEPIMIIVLAGIVGVLLLVLPLARLVMVFEIICLYISLVVILDKISIESVINTQLFKQ